MQSLNLGTGLNGFCFHSDALIHTKMCLRIFERIFNWKTHFNLNCHMWTRKSIVSRSYVCQSYGYIRRYVTPYSSTGPESTSEQTILLSHLDISFYGFLNSTECVIFPKQMDIILDLTPGFNGRDEIHLSLGICYIRCGAVITWSFFPQLIIKETPRLSR